MPYILILLFRGAFSGGNLNCVLYLSGSRHPSINYPLLGYDFCLATVALRSWTIPHCRQSRFFHTPSGDGHFPWPSRRTKSSHILSFFSRLTLSSSSAALILSLASSASRIASIVDVHSFFIIFFLSLLVVFSVRPHILLSSLLLSPPPLAGIKKRAPVLDCSGRRPRSVGG